MATEEADEPVMATEGADANPPAESFRLRVANLAWGTSDESFKEFFAKHNPTEAVVIRRKQTGRSRGYGFVTFDSQDNLDAALKLDGEKLDAREVKIAVSTSKGPYPEGSRPPAKIRPKESGAGDDDRNPRDTVEVTTQRLIVQRLAWDVTDEQLQEAFAAYGEIESAKVIRNRRNDRSRGYGFVTFKSEEAGKAALEAMDGNTDLGFSSAATDEAEAEKQGIRVVEARSSGPRPEGEAPSRAPRRRQRRRNDDNSGDEFDDDAPRPGPRRIFVRDLNEETTEDTIQKEFEQYGAIKNVRLIKDRETEKSRGFAYVTYEEHEDFKKALDAYAGDGGQIDGSDVKVSRAFPSRQGGRGRGRGRRGRRRGGRGGRGGGGKSEGPTDL